jgi:hypothetical protein
MHHVSCPCCSEGTLTIFRERRGRSFPIYILNAFTLQQILNHMNESAVYNETDLVPFHKRLSELRQIVQQDGEHAKHPKSLTKLLERQLSECGTPAFLSYSRLLKTWKPFFRGHSQATTRILGCSISRTRSSPPEVGHYSAAARHTSRKGGLSKG